MLMALLYDGEQLMGAAPASEQQPEGERYWREIYPMALDYRPGWETAYVEIRDPILVGRLMVLAYSNSGLGELQRAVEAVCWRAGMGARAQRAA
jgi:hypothetical protein